MPDRASEQASSSTGAYAASSTGRPMTWDCCAASCEQWAACLSVSSACSRACSPASARSCGGCS